MKLDTQIYCNPPLPCILDPLMNQILGVVVEHFRAMLEYYYS